jgi:NAD(P)-dependent dehydrogenase (short-subunit alcohol dehydrogenase family)
MNSETTIVITGANRGIGLELAKQAAKKGAHVICGVRTPAKATALKDALGLKGEILELDVSEDASVRQFADALRTRVKHVDVLINNAGITFETDASGVEVLESEMVLKTLNTNTVGPIRMTKALLPFLKAATTPKVATVSSLMGSLTDNKSGGAYAYRMSKAAVNMFMKTFSLDETGVIAISLHPGWVKTDMGGSAAPLEANKSAEGIWTVIETCTASDSGKFFNHAGRELPW